jgi:hypothetical protein
VLGVEKLARAGNALGVTLAQVSFFECLQVGVTHHEVAIDGDTPVSVLVQRKGPDDSVWHALFFEDGRQLVERLLGIGHAHEKSPAVFDPGDEACLCLG